SDLAADLNYFKREAKFEVVGAVLAADSERLEKAKRSARTVVVLGNEGHGLPEDLIATCSRKVELPMQPGVDSLNVAVASGVFLSHFPRLANAHFLPGGGFM